jgi:hypothetical protein
MALLSPYSSAFILMIWGTCACATGLFEGAVVDSSSDASFTHRRFGGILALALLPVWFVFVFVPLKVVDGVLVRIAGEGAGVPWFSIILRLRWWLPRLGADDGIVLRDSSTTVLLVTDGDGVS